MKERGGCNVAATTKEKIPEVLEVAGSCVNTYSGEMLK